MPEVTLTDMVDKIAGYWPAWSTRGGNNLARNTALASLFFDLQEQIQTARRNLSIDGSHVSEPVAVGVLMQPRSVSGVKFFHIPLDVMVTGGVVTATREHLLLHFMDGPRHLLRLDDGVPVHVDRTDVYRITDNESRVLYVMVDVDLLPAVDVKELVEFIPIYDEDFLAAQGDLYDIPRWRLEDDDHYRKRIKAWLARGGCSYTALREYSEEYASFYGWTAVVVEYREHYGAWPVVGFSCATDFVGYRKFKKDRSDNISYLTVELSGVPGELQETAIAELSVVLNRFRPQGLRYRVTVV